MEFTHISDLKGLSGEAKAFIAYFIEQDLPEIYENLGFVECNMPIGSKSIKYKAAFNNDLDGRLEYWIVFNTYGAVGLAKRLTYDDNFETTFVHFNLKHDRDSFINDTIAKMPMVIIH
ncbi:hypothetical protein L4D00_08000 [Photobacterium swingsii]|uniref:Uncharacterized protein n=2 Tax=Photobacterium swingsii TaxID=680026 RepID=A0A2T3P8Z7_9GAMM|nr:hypothetical protein [Photobacterium swingsii]PSW25298.1 hypothetical protein C9I94_06470 [Photobacterium swingsii]